MIKSLIKTLNMKTKKAKVICGIVMFVLTVYGCSKGGADEEVQIVNDFKIEVISGNNQDVFIGEVSSESIVVRLTNNGDAVSNADLRIQVSEGGGSVPSNTIVTDDEGKAQIQWTVGVDYRNRLQVEYHWGGIIASQVSVFANSIYRYVQPNSVDSWQVSNLTTEGFCTDKIENLVNEIRRGIHPRIHDLTIVRNGKMIFDFEFSEADLLRPGLAGLTRTDRTHYIASATKSIVSAVTGIAIDKGFIASEQVSAINYFINDYTSFENWSSLKEDVTLEDLLTMRAGYQCADGGAGSGWIDANDLVKYLWDLPMVNDPGTTFSYCSGSTAMIGEIIKKASGMSYEDFAQTHLFDPLGINLTEYHYHNSGIPSLGHGMWLKPTDMAKIGQMFLDNGVWNGQQIVSSNWVDKSTQTHQFLSGLGIHYGYYWWSRDFDVNGQDYRIYNAGGNGGQFIFVSIDLDLVVVFTAGNYDHPTLQSLPLDLMRSHILPCIQP